MSGFDPETGWCHFTSTKISRYYKKIENSPENIEKRLEKKGIQYYFDRHGGLHALCNAGTR